MNEKKEYAEIDILKLLRALLKRWWIILIAAVVGFAGAFVITKFFIKPTYSSHVMMYVNNSSGETSETKVSQSDLSAAESLVDTYIGILNARLTLDKVIEQSGVDYTYSQLSKLISASAVNNSAILKVTVTSTDADEAALIANTILNVLPTVIQEKIDGTRVSEIDYAVPNYNKVAPSTAKNCVIGVLICVVIACAVLVVMELLNDTLDGEDWIQETFKEDIPVLAIIPDSFESDNGSKYGGYYRKNYYSRNYYSNTNKTTDSAADGDESENS